MFGGIAFLLRGYVFVGSKGLKDDEPLKSWLQKCALREHSSTEGAKAMIRQPGRAFERQVHSA